MKLYLTSILLLTCLSVANCCADDGHVIELADAFGGKTVFRHHADGTLYAVESYQKNEHGTCALHARECYYWEENDGPAAVRLQASISEDPAGAVQECRTFGYDSTGRLKSEFTAGYENGELCEHALFSYTAEGCLENASSETSPQGDDGATAPSLWKKFSDLAKWCSDVAQYLSTVKEELSYSNYIYDDVEPVLEDVFGTGFLQFSGYYQQEHSRGSYIVGDKQVNDRVRITLINGILSLNSDLQESMEEISNTHGNHDIHYIFRATEGWTKDILNGTLVKFGYTSRQAHMLADLWIELIEELGGTESDGIIIHYAHSIGALDTYAAQHLLTPAQRRMIHVVTIGSPAMIPNEGFASVVNYASIRDGVCLLDPIRFLGGLFHDDHNITYLDTIWGVPLVDHPLSVESYQALIGELGRKFLDTYKVEFINL